MIKFDYVVKNVLGIHARPAALLAQFCVNSKSVVTISKDDKIANGSDVLKILSLKAMKGERLTITVEGGDEETTAAGLKELLHKEQNFLDEIATNKYARPSEY